MEVITMETSAYKDIINRMEYIAVALVEKKKNPKEIFVDNQEFIKLMNISKRTAQTWRDEGIIGFSQIGHKIYYRMSDIHDLLDNNYNKAFNTNK